MNWFADFSDCVREHVLLAPLTWYKLGGPARWLIEPRDEARLAAVLRRCADAGVEVRFLGKGANLLVSDEGVRGAVVRLAGPYWERVEELNSTGSNVQLFAAAGADLMRLVKETAQRGLAGLEGLAGIPASIGGAVRMNCGGRYGEIGPRIRSVRVVSPDGTTRDRSVRFGYRSTNLGADRVLGATIELTAGEPRAVFDEYRRIWDEKTASQPALSQRTAGCVFRNPTPPPLTKGGHGGVYTAGQLIDACGLKGLRVGGAEVSPIHANFIVAHAAAAAADVLDLADEVAARVEAETGVKLDLEIEVWGRRTKSARPAHRPMRRVGTEEAPALALAGAGQGG